MTRSLLSIALVAALAACTGERTPADGAAAPEPAVDTAPATPAPAPDAPANPTPDAMPDTGATDAGNQLASFKGYGDVTFGTASADMAEAWGGELKALGKEYNERCYFMNPVAVSRPADFNFMIGDDRFVRYGVESERYTAPGGGKVGMTKAEIAKLYAGIKESQHAYTDGQYLEIKDPAGGNALLVFETDGKGDDAKVTEWRVGTPPHVGYVEGCS